MSTEASNATDPATADGRHNRSAKNYLLDRRFQLKYTGLLVGIALLLSISLGAVIWRSSSTIVEQNGRAVELGFALVDQGNATVDRGKQVLEQSRKVSQVVAMNIAKEYADDPELAKTFREATQRDESALAEEQARLERDAASISKRAEELRLQAQQLEVQQQTLRAVIVVALALLVIALGVAGIMFTHKVAGPIHKMKRLLREVGRGKLVMRERLRKGDELIHFFEAFEQMVMDLRGRQESEIARVDEILDKLEGAPRSERGLREFDEDGVALLKQLRAEMREQIDA
jgi:nitrogen fixation/metabolism regulation signal transduction histidine kinase